MRFLRFKLGFCHETAFFGSKNGAFREPHRCEIEQAVLGSLVYLVILRLWVWVVWLSGCLHGTDTIFVTGEDVPTVSTCGALPQDTS